MKTIAFNRQGGLFRGLVVLAAVGGLYAFQKYFRKQGGSVSGLLSKGTQGLSSARQWVNKTAPSVSQSARM